MISAIACIPLLWISSPYAGALGTSLQASLSADEILNHHPDLKELDDQIRELRRKADLLNQQAGIRRTGADKLRTEAQSLRDSAFGQSERMTGMAAEERGMARGAISAAASNRTTLAYAGHNLGGSWGGLAGWVVGSLVKDAAESEAQTYENQAARREVEARQSESEAQIKSAPLESRAGVKDAEADKLSHRAKMFESLATAKEILLNTELLRVRIELLSMHAARQARDIKIPAVVPNDLLTQ